MNVLEKMTLNEETYSKSEMKVYRTIKDKPELVVTNTITKIAQLSHTSVSAVLRFCQRLGYVGYKDFRFDMVQTLNHVDSNADSEKSGDYVSAIANLFSDTIRNLADLDREMLNRLVSDITQADMIYTMGLYRSYIPAEKCRISLTDQGKRTISIGDTISFSHIGYSLTEQSTILIFSVNGEGLYYEDTLKTLKNVTDRIYLVTFNPNPQLKKYISNIFVLPSADTVNLPTLDEHAVMMVFIEILTTMMIHSK